MKKLITIILVLVMLASIFVLPAMAAEIQPRYPIGYCSKCGEVAEYRGMAGSLYKYYCEPCGVWTYR